MRFPVGERQLVLKTKCIVFHLLNSGAVQIISNKFHLILYSIKTIHWHKNKSQLLKYHLHRASSEKIFAGGRHVSSTLTCHTHLVNFTGGFFSYAATFQIFSIHFRL